METGKWWLPSLLSFLPSWPPGYKEESHCRRQVRNQRWISSVVWCSNEKHCLGIIQMDTSSLLCQFQLCDVGRIIFLGLRFSHRLKGVQILTWCIKCDNVCTTYFCVPSPESSYLRFILEKVTAYNITGYQHGCRGNKREIWTEIKCRWGPLRGNCGRISRGASYC